MIRTHLAAALTAAMLATAGLATPAAAGGSVSITYTPTNAKDARMLAAGLMLYSIYQTGKAGGSISQYGFGNAAGLAQWGSGNVGVISQKGTNHNATLTQTGNGNAYGIFQFGNGTSSNVVQNGNGQTGITIQAGW